MKPTTPVRKFTTVDKFVEAVNACSRTYAEQKGNGNAYKAEISALFQVAKQQNLTLPRKHIWGESGIGALLITRPQQTTVIASLRKILYELISTELAPQIVDDPTESIITTPANPYLPKRKGFTVTALPRPINRPDKKRTAPGSKKAPPQSVGDSHTEASIPVNISDEMRHVLHAYILEKPNRSTIVLNYDIAPRKEKYEQAYQFCQPYLRTLNPLPDNIQTINQQIAERFKKLLSQNATYFKDAEKNGYLHTRIETLLAYLKEQFPTHNKPAEKG